jgi:hypothetical protein
LGNDEFNLIYKSDDLEELENLAISPYLNIKQIHEMWEHYPHGLHMQKSISKYILLGENLPDSQVVSLISIDITRIQNLVKKRLNSNCTILTKEIVKAICEFKMPVGTTLMNKILNNPETKMIYLQHNI